MRIITIFCCLFFVSLSHANGNHHGKLLQNEFDHLGPTMKTFASTTGQDINYLDEGNQNWQPVVFIGGSGTSGRVFALLEFLRTTRENLGLRFIAIERNGFGHTQFDETLGHTDYAEDVEELLAHLGVEKFSLFAISGGGPYSAEIASRNPDRLISVHLAATITYFDSLSALCAAPAENLTFFTQNPMIWFGFSPDSSIQKIPGFQDAAFDDAARTFNMGGQVADPAALYHEFQLYCGVQTLPDLSLVRAPVYLYYGEIDTSAPIDPHAIRWQNAYSSVDVKKRFYPDEGHDVQYRHYDQILADIAGLTNKIVVCRNGKTRLVKERKVRSILAKGGSLGICAWQD
jgi:pimeloyl-ACP methyl ester carboxylesterase